MRIDGRMTEKQVEFPRGLAGESARQRSVTSIPRSDAPDGLGAEFGTAARKQEAAVKPQPVIDVHKAVKTLSDFVSAQRKDISFSVDEEADAMVIRFFKTETGELIKQYPPEEILAMIARMRQLSGWLVDERV